jgi:DNA-directed RNA polymerase specialized sigma24 family protein
MRSYQYDPGGSFRGWLRRLGHHRAIDLVRERRDRRFEAMNEELIDGRCLSEDVDKEGDNGEAAAGRRALQEALAVEEEVRRKVEPIRWESFWRVAIEGQSVSQAAAELGLKYATVYAGMNHVAELLRAEGQRRKAKLGFDDSSD